MNGEQKSERRSDSIVIEPESHFPLTGHQAGTSFLSGVAQGAGHLRTLTGVSSDLVSGNHYSLNGTHLLTVPGERGRREGERKEKLGCGSWE